MKTSGLVRDTWLFYPQVPSIHVIIMVDAVKYAKLRKESGTAAVLLVMNCSMASGVYERIVIVQQTSSLVPTANVFLAPLFVILMMTAVINRMK